MRDSRVEGEGKLADAYGSDNWLIKKFLCLVV
jgi:hypothetical protein